MAEQHKYRKTKLSHFFDYSEDNISAEDRHAFEKRLQADPFESEAADGFKLVSRAEALKDIASSSKRIKNRINRRNRIAWYSTAAALASMLIIGSIFLDLSDKNLKEDEAFKEIVAPAIEGPSTIQSTDKKGTGPVTTEPTEGPQQADQEKAISPDVPAQDEADEKNTVASESIVSVNKSASAPARNVSTGDKKEEEESRQAEKMEKEARMTEERKRKESQEAVEEGAKNEGYIEDNAFAWETMSEEATEGRYNIQKERKVILQETQAVKFELLSDAVPENTSSIVSGTITGVVISADDMNPVPGVNLNIKGTEIGTVTDFNGEFRLNTNDLQQGTVIASYIGMETEEFPFSSGETIEIALNPDEVSLEEVVVVGYGFHSQKEKTESATGFEKSDNSIEYKSANPVEGMTRFKEYIDSTLVNPEIDEIKSRNVVILRFHISEEGRPIEFKVIKSPGDNYSQEAIRVVKEGPDWSPASRFGEYINESVRLRIVFK